MTRGQRVLGWGAAALLLGAAVAVLVLGEMRGPKRHVVAIPPLGPPPAMARLLPATAASPATGDARLPAIDRWLEAGGDGDETALGDPATYDAAMVEALMKRYEAMPFERRRERGALVYLLSRTTPEKDAVAFLTRVLREKPCASLTNCASPASGHDDHDPSLVTTLAYPQLMALAMAEQRAKQSPMAAEWRALAEEARQSEVQSVKRRAERWLASAPQ